MSCSDRDKEGVKFAIKQLLPRWVTVTARLMWDAAVCCVSERMFESVNM